MRIPLSLIGLGALMYAIGFALGSNDIDPASAIVATAGTALAAVGLVWAVVTKVRGRQTAS